MLRKINHQNMGTSDLGWLKSLFHFSFAEYYNPANMNFGVLRVINDDLVKPGTGFDTHPHRDMEIISYVVEGELTHGDSMGNKQTLTRGQVQYMSAGSGILHSEHNRGHETSRFLQIWIKPDQRNLTPQYGDYRFSWEDRVGKWLNIVSGQTGTAPVKINQDANLFVTALQAGEKVSFSQEKDRQTYFVLIEGEAKFGEHSLSARDALEAIGETVEIEALTDAHVIAIEMKRE